MANKIFSKCYQEWLWYCLLSPLRYCVEAILKRKNRVVLYRLWGDGLGDAIAMTTILSAYHNLHGSKGIIFSKFPIVFENNPLVSANLDYEGMPKLLRSVLKSICKYTRGSRVLCVGGETWTPGTLPWQRQPTDFPNTSYYDGLQPDVRHRVATHEVAPSLVFSEEEQQRYAERFQHLPQRYCLVKASVGVNRHTAATLKEWNIEGMQAVIHATSALSWIQIGERGEMLLEGVTNLLGETDLRETFYLLSRAQVVLTVEGMVSHAAAAFDVPTVVVFSGMHSAEGLLYKHTIPVTAKQLPACAPCWKSECTVAGKPCTQAISVEQVVDAVRQALDIVKA